MNIWHCRVFIHADKDYNRGLLALQSAVDEEEKRIEDEDRDDVNNYRKGVVNARRQSLIYRNQFEVIDILNNIIDRVGEIIYGR